MEGGIPIRGQDIEVRVHDNTSVKGRGFASCVGSSGIEVRFAAEETPGLLLGGWTTLELRLPDLDEPLRSSARVSQRQVGRGQCFYHFDFAPDAADMSIPFILRSTLNRRRAVRVAPPTAGQEVYAVLTSEVGAEVRALVTDLSEGGLGVRVPFPKDRHFAVGDEITLTLGIEGNDAPLRARVYHMRARGAVVHMGMGFIAQRCDTAALEQVAGRVAELRQATSP